MKIIILLILLSYVCARERTSTTCNILALSGGGAHGSFEIGVIDNLNRMGYNWDIITGVSVGSINVGMLSMYTADNQTSAISKLKSLWLNLTSDKVYTRNYNPIYDQSIYDNTPLCNTIYQELKPYNGTTKRKFYISSVEVNTGKYTVFSNSDVNNIKSLVDIIISSSSIPIYFPPKLMNNKYYMDGGLYNNELIDSAVKFCKKYNRTNITIDVVLASNPLTNMSTSDIGDLTIFGMGYRTYQLLMNSMFNHELYKDCNKGYPMYIYYPTELLYGGLLDFNKDYLTKNYYIGYNSTSPMVTNYCL